MKIISRKPWVFFLLLLVSSCAQFSNENALEELQAMDWKVECHRGLIQVNSDEIQATLEPKNKRCEVANTTWLVKGEEFEFTFDVVPQFVNDFDSEWHSVMQFHSFPDKKLGEKWRCPISALEVKNGYFRMYNRWDSLKKSELVKGTCADLKNSIKSRLLFENYKIQSNIKYKIKISGLLSPLNNGYLVVSINDVVVGSVKGPTMFNDARNPYIKLGVYKPTHWQHNKTLNYSFSSIIFRDLK